jgi:hypothetical protein
MIQLTEEFAFGVVRRVYLLTTDHCGSPIRRRRSA